MNNPKSNFRKPKPDKARLLAFEIFTEIMRNDGYSNLLLNQRLNRDDLDRRDKSFITELVYGSIRQIGRNDFIIKKFIDRNWESIDSGIVDILRMGAYQLFDMRIPTHAAVSATVELARATQGEAKGSFINAIMRRLSESPLEEHLKEVSDDSISSLAVRFSHPEWIINSYRDHISDISELKELLLANNRAVAPTLVAWPGKSTVAELEDLGCTPTKYSKYGATFEGVPADLALVRERKVGVQDEGSQLVAIAFAEAAKAEQPWLDLCAGPGGKAALLSYLATGIFYANEISEVRAKLVKQVVSSSTSVTTGDGREIAINFKQESGSIKSILADVPCTGLGALRRRPEVRWRRNLTNLAELTALQYQLAESAINFLPSGGIFGYATCSPHYAETIAQCANFEKRFPIERIDITPFLPTEIEGAVKNGYMQLWPHRHQTDAMFLALYRKR